MLLDWIDFGFTLKADRDLGLYGTEQAFETVGDNKKKQLVRQLLLDKDELPVIPVSTLKGALRASARKSQIDGAIIKNAFGYTEENAEQNTKSAGSIGRLQFKDAKLEKTQRDQVEIVTRNRTAIDRARGSAEDHKLFRSKHFKKDLIFKVKGFYYFDKDLEKAEQDLAQILSLFSQGISIGAGAKMGDGRLSYQNDLNAAAHQFDGDEGIWKKTKLDSLVQILRSQNHVQKQKDALELNLTLTSETPFLVVDGDKKGDGKGDGKPNVLALKDGNKHALPETSLYGALRSRAAWVENLRKMRAGEDDKMQADDRFLENENPLNGAVRDPAKDLHLLTPIERLFGVAGFAGLLEFRSHTQQKNGENFHVVNVAIDRFTGGALESALMRSEVEMGAVWTIKLGVEATRYEQVCNLLADHNSDSKTAEDYRAEDRALLELLQADLNENGIMLGHGAAKGFGWFGAKAEVKQETQA